MPLLTPPSNFPVWASSDQTDPISGQNNVLVPPPEKQTYGWSRSEFPPRQWFNWLARVTNQWIEYLAQQSGQSIVTNGDGASAQFDVVNGGLCYIYVVDTGNASNIYHGMIYLPPASSSPSYPISFIDIKKVGLTTPTIDSGGHTTIAGGTGPYISYGQTKTL